MHLCLQQQKTFIYLSCLFVLFIFAGIDNDKKLDPIIERLSVICCERRCIGSYNSLTQDVMILKAAFEEIAGMKRIEKRQYMKWV